MEELRDTRVVISVNASTDPSPEMDGSNKSPSLKETITAVTDVQLQRYSAATEELERQSLQRWARELSAPGRPVTLEFIRIGFRDFEQPETRRFSDNIPTSFKLSNEQVDRLIAAGRELLRNNPDYRRLVSDLGGSLPAR
jgi:NTE family protein